MITPIKAPVIVSALEADGAASAPALIWNGSGVISVFMQSSEGGFAHIVFGPDEDMPTATLDNAFPVPYEGVVWKLGPSTRYASVIAHVPADFGAVIYYFLGQTDVTT